MAKAEGPKASAFLGEVAKPPLPVLPAADRVRLVCPSPPTVSCIVGHNPFLLGY
jgi:hypothetical protein